MTRGLEFGVLACAFSIAVAAEDAPVKAPYVELGDCWSYRADRLSRRGAIDSYEVCVSYIDKRQDVILAVAKVNNGGREIDVSYSSEWAPATSLSGTIFTPRANFFQFPLLVGNTYSSEYEYRRAFRGPNQGKATWKITVIGWEDITVPAGTFRALRIEGRGFFRRFDNPSTFNATFTAWYAREVNRHVKYQYKDPGEQTGEELTAYRLNR